ncbi:hypothetical protein GINT2_000423 [Glugoides intestinalis]
MKLIGAHLSIAKGLEKIQEQMELLDCKTCAIFLKNQKQFIAKELSADTINKFREVVKDKEVIVPHGSYLVNLANPETVERHMECFLDDLRRCFKLGIRLYNLHPGSDTKKIGKEESAKLIANNLNRAMKEVPEVVILLENMAGQGNVYGRTFEELKAVIELVEDKERIGVTLDTCHMFAGGYDIRTAESFEKVMKEFDEKVGKRYLKALHLNDSLHGLDSRKDRHASIGEGKIGIEAFKFIMKSSYFEELPMILETPFPEKYSEEIKLLKRLELS